MNENKISLAKFVYEEIKKNPENTEEYIEKLKMMLEIEKDLGIRIMICDEVEL